MIERLLSHLYSALDRDPQLRPVARLALPGGHVREVAGDELRVWRADGAEVGRMALTGRSLADVLQWLAESGVEVVVLDWAATDFSALALPEGRISENDPGGALLSVPSSPLWTILRPIGRELVEASGAVDEARAQLYLRTASGEWLDFWGLFFGLEREGRGDDEYRQYLIAETLRPRSNPRAIESAVWDATGQRTSIYEPVFDLFRLSRSSLDDAHLRDGDFWSHGVIVPQGPLGTRWQQALPIIHRNRPAGVVLRGPVTVPPVFSADYQDSGFSGVLASEALFVRRVFLPGDPRLGEYVLDVDEWIRNHRFGWYEARSHYGARASTDGAPLYGPRTVDLASIVMSDGWRLGEPGAVFGRGGWAWLDDAHKTILSVEPGLGERVRRVAFVRHAEVFANWSGHALAVDVSGFAWAWSAALMSGYWWRLYRRGWLSSSWPSVAWNDADETIAWRRGCEELSVGGWSLGVELQPVKWGRVAWSAESWEAAAPKFGVTTETA